MAALSGWREGKRETRRFRERSILIVLDEYRLNACLTKPQDRIEVLAALHASIQEHRHHHQNRDEQNPNVSMVLAVVTGVMLP
jgi:hypothetical protein